MNVSSSSNHKNTMSLTPIIKFAHFSKLQRITGLSFIGQFVYFFKLQPIVRGDLLINLHVSLSSNYKQ